MGHCADPVCERGLLFCLGHLSCRLRDSGSAGAVIKREPGLSVLAVKSLSFWQQRWERALWLLISDPALLPPAAGPASSTPSPLLASLTLPTRPLQTPLDFKHLLAFHINGTTPLSLFPNFSTVGAGQKVGTYAGGRGAGGTRKVIQLALDAAK